jgi:BolA protein
MRIQDSIERKLAERFAPAHLDVVNESGSHNVPRGSETHFKVVLVAPEFEGLRLIARHRLVNATLADELAGGVHALALHTYTEPEWRARFGSAPLSPPCLGGRAAEAISTDSLGGKAAEAISTDSLGGRTPEAKSADNLGGKAADPGPARHHR